MGTDIDLLFWTPSEQSEEAYYQMVRRLLKATGTSELRIGRESMPISLATQKLRYRLDTEPYGEWGSLDVGMCYDSPFGENLGLRVTLRRGHDDAATRSFKASIALSVLLADCLDRNRSLAMLIGRGPDPMGLLGGAEVDPQYQDLWGCAWQAADNLRIAILQSLDVAEGEIPIPHAAVRWEECVWESPLRARMIYHADVREFAQDFVRIHLEARYEWWDYDATYLRPPLQVLEEAVAARMERKQDEFVIAASDSCGDETPQRIYEMRAFVELLDRARAERWAQAPAASVETALYAAAEQTRNIRIDRIKQGGFLVGTHLFNNLREFYVKLGSLLDQATSS